MQRTRYLTQRWKTPRLPHRLLARVATATLLAALSPWLVAGAEAPASGLSRQPTVQTRIGIWYRPGAPEQDRLWKPGDPGEPLFLRGRVIDVRGRPVSGALVELWHADTDGFVEPGQFRASLRTDENGSFKLATVLPGYIFGPRHIHFLITHDEHPKLVTRIFFRRDPVIELHDYPAVVVVLEDGTAHGQRALFGTVEFVMPVP